MEKEADGRKKAKSNSILTEEICEEASRFFLVLVFTFFVIKATRQSLLKIFKIYRKFTERKHSDIVIIHLVIFPNNYMYKLT